MVLSSPNAASKANVLHVLDSKRSLAINIMLKQFKTGSNEILEALQNGTSVALEKLKGIQRVLPTDDEVFKRCVFQISIFFYFFFLFVCFSKRTIWKHITRRVPRFVYLDENGKGAHGRRRHDDSRNGRIILFGPRPYIQLSFANKTHDRGKINFTKSVFAYKWRDCHFDCNPILGNKKKKNYLYSIFT